MGGLHRRGVAAGGESAVERPRGATADKVVDLHRLAAISDELRASGEKLVLCHGVFDLLHVGHLRHLKTAGSNGDILVVTITGDSYVNKGPGRPAFTSSLRAEVLAGLDIVNYVAIIEDPSALTAIEAVKPHVYVKGGEYADIKGDITGKIAAEIELVERLGGTVHFTDDITFSSSNLLNRHFDIQNSATRAYLDTLRDTDFEQQFIRLLGKISQLKIVVIGETIIDRYVYVEAMGKSAKENILATLRRDEEVFAGGAVAIANHLAGLSPNVELITVVGDPAMGENYESFVRERLDGSAKLSLIYRPDGPTVEKTRFVEPTYVRKLFELYTMDDNPLPQSVQQQFRETLSAKLKDADIAIVCDFGHGFFDAETIALLENEARFLAVNVQSNAGNIGYNMLDKYARANFMCIDAMEARLAVRDKHADLAEVVGTHLPALVNCDNFIVTHGRSGCFAKGKDGVVNIPAFSASIVDTVGAGDAFFSVAAPCLAAGGSCEMAAFAGNIAGAIKIGIIGHRRYLTRLDIQRSVAALLK